MSTMKERMMSMAMGKTAAPESDEEEREENHKQLQNQPPQYEGDAQKMGEQQLDYDPEDYKSYYIQRAQQNGMNRQCDVGIHTIEIYYPQFYIKQTELEEYDASPERYGPSVIGKYTKGIGQIEARLTTDDEDPISFVMTAVHRLVERMDQNGMNQTAKFAEDEKTIPAWNAIGRLDIGTESILDRSKSMKSYVMDLFERYGDGESNIEGVDMYNACYGGQAAGLSVVNWVESDRWDGRYGVAVATDISDAHSSHLFTVGAACTATVFFPDAPIAHHGQRASAILHRFDFFKPVGWHSMAPLVDGKYSIEVYMDCIDICCSKLREKCGGKPIFSMCDYNVFHTGGGFHVVKKAFERVIRFDEPKCSAARRAELVENQLLPSCHLLKIIGPCHTVSSFLNISSVAMSQWEKAVGKNLIVFTYGSGAAASMYQLHFHELPWMKPLAQWKVEFYRNAIYCHPSTKLQDDYMNTWMQFGLVPHAARDAGIDPHDREMDAYYLMEIDNFGRRFYHRGGWGAGNLDEKYRLYADDAEGRPRRLDWGPLPPKPLPPPPPSQEEKWKSLESDMVYEYEHPGETPYDVVEETHSKTDPKHKIILADMKEEHVNRTHIDNDNLEHCYQIVGSWTRRQEAQDMVRERDGSFSFVVTLGENAWEDFFLIQDNDWDRRIFPAYAKSWKAMPCVGPHRGGSEEKRWLLDGRSRDDVPTEDLGDPGDQYRVNFHWESVKGLEWDKLEGQTGEYTEGSYQVCGSWRCGDPEPMEAVGDGRYAVEVQMTSMKMEFTFMRNEDVEQIFVPTKKGAASGDAVVGPVGADGSLEDLPKWVAAGDLGDVFRLEFYRDPEAPLDIMEVTWSKIGNRPVVEPRPRYWIIGGFNDWGTNAAKLVELKQDGNSSRCTGYVELTKKQEQFQIVENKLLSRRIHPDKKDCMQQQVHLVSKPENVKDDLCWCVGKASADKSAAGERWAVHFDSAARKVAWNKA